MREALTGDADAQYRLGLVYASGLGVDEDRSEAARWYRLAAEKGVSIAQKNLAEMLASGNGVEQNFVEAYMWYAISLPKLVDGMGYTFVRLDRDNLTKKMKPEDIAKAEDMAAAWISKHKERTGKETKLTGANETEKSASQANQVWSCPEKPVKDPVSERLLNPCLLALRTGKWIMIHHQKKGDAVRFQLQEHGGSAFDTRRGRIVLFGSDTHSGSNKKAVWINSPLLFDVARLRWRRFYPDDQLSTYTVHKSGVPVAGQAKDHPWAMHTYGAVTYDIKRDEIVVSSHPQHLLPGKFTNAVSHLWGFIKNHPTWTLSFKTNRWAVIPGKSESFFLHSTVYDSDRGLIIGYREDGVFQLGGRQRKWRRLAKRGYLGNHSNAVYDSKHKSIVVFGNRPVSNDIVLYQPSTGRHRVMPTLGVRPPKDRHAPMAYHPILERTVVLVDQESHSVATRAPTFTKAETWLYDAGKDSWTERKSALMPLGLGMNYNMVYDPGHNILFLVAEGKDNVTTVWALRL